MHIPLDPSRPEPIYAQISAGIAEAILRGDLAAGDALPSIRALARDLRVSVITTTRAYNELVADGLAVGHQGRGMFVRDQAGLELRERAEQRIRAALAEAARAARIAGVGPIELHRLLDEEMTEPTTGEER